MALNKTVLKDAILDMATGSDQPASPVAAAEKFAGAYRSYAADAEAPAGPLAKPVPAALDTAEITLVAGLFVAFSAATAVDASQAMATALDAFWMAPPMAFLPAPPALLGAVTASTGAPVLQGMLAAMSPYQPDGVTPTSAEDAATEAADAIDAFTKLVIVTSPLPPPGSPIIGPLT